MTASFAAYASQFLNRQQQPSSVASSSQPLFYSFTTDNGSQPGDMSHGHDDTELYDDDDPHLGRSSDYLSRRTEIPQDDDDPYLRLDEDDSRAARYDADSIPLIASESASRPATTEPVQGWLAHHSPMSYRVTPSPPSDTSSDSDEPRPDLYTHATQAPARIVSAPRPRQENLLTESLLPRDGVARPLDVFSLPDPRSHSRGRHKDYYWTVAWLGSVTACVIGSFVILFTTSTPSHAPRGTVIPYTTLLHTIPLLTILTFLSAVMSYVHIMLLRIFVKPVMFATSVFIPATLFISAIWAFVGSFIWEDGVEPSWGETVGLRLFSLIPFILAIVTSRRLMHLPQEIHATSSILTLSTSLLISNPLLLALSPVILLLALLSSIPFLTLSFRLLLIGYFHDTSSIAWEWHVKNWVGWAIAGTISVWLWSWGIARGVLRTSCAAVIGAWYFSPPEVPEPPPMDTYRAHAALRRSTDMSLGSIVLSALLLTGVRILSLLSGLLRKAPMPFIPWFAFPLNLLENMTGTLSTLALVYVGLTGDAFFSSAKRARALTSAVSNSGGRVKYRRSGLDPSLAILAITPLTLTFPFALSTYLFVAHTLNAPGYAPVAALLAGGVTVLVGRFCVGLVEDTADTLYMCYCIDRDVGAVHREDVFHAFEWQTPAQVHTQHSHTAMRTPQSAVPPPRLVTHTAPPLNLSDEDVTMPQSTGQSHRDIHPPTLSYSRKSDESRESDGSMMLGLDFV
ncbi:hypothetical protein M0805_008978 [Coniferiporia weirii]|nr:hypothetical protein M0805_008978 [Coniferiporia weirii]